jgi:hypothetical protein
MGKPEVKNHLEDLDVVGRIILKWLLKNCYVMVWAELMWFRIGTSSGLM